MYYCALPCIDGYKPDRAYVLVHTICLIVSKRVTYEIGWKVFTGATTGVARSLSN